MSLFIDKDEKEGRRLLEEGLSLAKPLGAESQIKNAEGFLKDMDAGRWAVRIPIFEMESFLGTLSGWKGSGGRRALEWTMSQKTNDGDERGSNSIITTSSK